jgi:signal transduction histidine kinase
MARRSLLITYIASYLLSVGATIRYLVLWRDNSYWPIGLLLCGYLVLLFAEPFFIRRNRLLTDIYLVVQTAIICTLSYIGPDVDFWAILYCPLIVQVMHKFPQRTGFLITGGFTAITLFFMLLVLGLEQSLPLTFVYGVVYFLLAALIAIIREALAAREEIQKQQDELQAAHRQLQTYTAHAEELAVLQERNRLARELHDSVTQSLYSLTLLAEAGQRMIKTRDLQQIEGNQARLGEIAQQALQEMRLLVYELRPLALKNVGLIGALNQRLEAVERRSGVEARFEVDGEFTCSETLEEELYRIAQEALNNALKHARASEVKVHVRCDKSFIVLEVVDNGSGFDLHEAGDKGGMGLTSMSERAAKIGGTLTLQSSPGQGTRVRVEVDNIPPENVINDHSDQTQQEAPS